MIGLQKISTRLMVPIALVTIVFSSLLYGVAGNFIGKMMTHNLERLGRSKMADMLSSEKRISESMLAQASLFSEAQAVLAAYGTAHQGDINAAADPQLDAARKQLREYFSSIEKGLKSNLDGQPLRLHFHLPSARSLLRVWNAKQNKSDDLREFRETVLAISKTQQRLVGVEVGRGGFEIRGIAPILTPDKKYLGSVEALSSYDPLVHYGVSNEKENLAVYMNKSLLGIASELQDAGKHPVIGDAFVFVSSSGREVTDSLVNHQLLSSGAKGLHMEEVGEDFVTLFPINDFSGKQVGVMAYVYNAKELYAQFRAVKQGILGLSLGLLLAILVPLYFSVRAVTVPIKRTVVMLKEIAQGEGDLTRRMEILKKDEIGELASWFNQFLDRLERIIRDFGSKSRSLELTSENFNVISTQLAENTVSSSGRSQRVAQGAEAMSNNMASVAASCEEAAINLDTVASAVEEMAATVKEIAGSSENARVIAENAASVTIKASEKVNRLGGDAKEIGKVTEVITEISEQTNLLALNATIEAARAGEAGKGFAVVANEIKELARQTAQATGEIKGKITAIQDSASDTVGEIERISGIIHEVNEIVATIATAVEEQAVTTGEIAENLSQASMMIREVNVNVSEVSTVAGDITADIRDVSHSSEEMNIVSSQLSTYAQDLLKLSERLSEVVGRFRTKEARFDIGQVKAAHMQWRARLEAVLNGKMALPPEEVSSDRECQFGKWYFSPKGQELRDRPYFAEVGDLHAKVHQLALRIAELMKQGDKQRAQALMDDFEKAREQLFIALDELYLY